MPGRGLFNLRGEGGFLPPTSRSEGLASLKLAGGELAYLRFFFFVIAAGGGMYGSALIAAGGTIKSPGLIKVGVSLTSVGRCVCV